MCDDTLLVSLEVYGTQEPSQSSGTGIQVGWDTSAFCGCWGVFSTKCSRGCTCAALCISDIPSKALLWQGGTREILTEAAHTRSAMRFFIGGSRATGFENAVQCYTFFLQQ